jgi:hypothetical protein
MNDPDNSLVAGDWHCGGWEGAELETLRTMSRLTFEQKLDWLEQAQRLIADLHGWEAALQSSGTLVRRSGINRE